MFCRWTVLTLSLLTVGPALAADVARLRFIQGSWVNLRADAGQNAAVITQLTINTEVALLGEQNKSCEISWQDKRGFVPCRLLSEKKLTIAEFERYLPGGSENVRYSAPRLFWLAPSAARLVAAGESFWESMLTPAQKLKEAPVRYASRLGKPIPEIHPETDKVPPLVRYPIPEFDAMKALLKAGIVVAPEKKPVYVRWPDAEAAHKADRLGSMGEAASLLDGLIALAKPTAISPSLFKRDADLAPPGVGIEALSALFQFKETLKPLAGPRWEWTDYREIDPHYSGAWDLGSFELRLDHPVYEHRIGSKGEVGVYEWMVTDKWEPNFVGTDCFDGFIEPQGKQLMPGYAKVSKPLTWFYTAAALPHKKATVVSRTLKFPKHDSVNRLEIRDIDLNGDKVPDLALWQVMDSDGLRLSAHILLANIGGVWTLISGERESICT
ncbi:SH3 domain-containing protein [Parachitinimonas caeni]|uniref:SH3 domain-containing protein n=1 Tax=Parachitinimonas caeni TaxID=3031301 RepID=A0ABT7E2B2_9NEIS|nr:SH3 domain-containing protein [Parachitinimonas caeni]MDK2126389.1 SH3 domain-containing protein [Parachitinimonas caeni]